MMDNIDCSQKENIILHPASCILHDHIFITVFTPAYNRAHLLPRAYESLKRQGYRDFEWIIVDDGSTDDTEAVVGEWLENKDFPIRYIKKQNGGKHTAINRGVEEAKGELFFILDSDDMLTDDALQIVADEYETVRGDSSFGGVCGLDCYQDGKIVGGGLPQETIDCNAVDIRYKYHVTGDMKEVFRTEVLREFPFPEIQGERFCPEQLVWFRIAQKYKLHYFNKPIYIAEYQGDGLTAGITRARMNSPVASMICYQEMTTYSNVPFVEKCKAAINYWRFRCCRNNSSDEYAPKIGIADCLFAPLGYIMHIRDIQRQNR